MSVLAAVAAVTGASAAWTPARRLSAPGAVLSPGIGVDARGATTFAWLRRTGGGGRVVLRRRSADGTLGPLIDASTPGEHAANLRLAVAASGRAVVVWSVRGRTGPSQILARALPARGPLSPVVTVTATARRNIPPPQVLVDASGDAVLVWTQFAGEIGSVMARRWPAGGELGPEVDISATASDAAFHDPSVAIDADGDALFVWESLIGKRVAIVARPWPRSGAPGAITVVSKAPEYVEAPHVVLAPDGSGIVAWGGQPPDRGSVYLWVRRRSATGELGPRRNLKIGDYHPGIALGVDGTAYFTGSYDIDPDGEVRAATLSPSGDITTTEEPFTYDHQTVQIAARPGGALLAWSHHDAASLFARTLSNAGALGPPIRVSPPSRRTRQPAIAVDRAGGAQVVWIGDRGANRSVQTAAEP